jgi:hypothetical protein
MAIIHHGKLLYQGAPSQAENAIAGCVWAKSMTKQELHERTWQYPILSTKLVAGIPYVRVFSESDPGYGFAPSEPDLEDVFFSFLSRA